MKTSSHALAAWVGLLLLGLHHLAAQPPPAAVALPPGAIPPNVAPRPLPPSPAIPITIGTVAPGDFHTVMVVDPTTGVPVSKPPEIRFDLDFSGGTPEELVQAIEEAGVGSLNVIIPRDLADTEVPAMRVKAVTVPQLFEALAQASRRTVTYPIYTGGTPMYGPPPLQQKETSFGFRTQGEPSATSIWIFYAERLPTSAAPVPPRVVRFYQLASYLEADRYTVDDITTAIQTGWRMLGDDNPPVLNFHKDTKLLIALGTETQLRMIEEVLSQLNPRPSPTTTPTPVRQLQPRPVTPATPPEANLPVPLPPPSPSKP